MLAKRTVPHLALLLIPFHAYILCLDLKYYWCSPVYFCFDSIRTDCWCRKGFLKPRCPLVLYRNTEKNQPPREQPVAACLVWGPFAVQTAACSHCALEAKSRWQSEGSEGHVSDCKREGPAELSCPEVLMEAGDLLVNT